MWELGTGVMLQGYPLVPKYLLYSGSDENGFSLNLMTA